MRQRVKAVDGCWKRFRDTISTWGELQVEFGSHSTPGHRKGGLEAAFPTITTLLLRNMAGWPVGHMCQVKALRHERFRHTVYPLHKGPCERNEVSGMVAPHPGPPTLVHYLVPHVRPGVQ